MSLESVMERVTAAAERAGRDPSEVAVVVVSKGRDEAAIEALYAAGHRAFGENRASELAAKAGRLPADITWHFVGHLQSNKARTVRPIVTVLHSLDRVSLAKAWLKGSGPPPPAFLQVNIGHEPQKSGVDPAEAVELAHRVRSLGIELVGLMAILPILAEPGHARAFFESMARLRAEAAAVHPSMTGLSMGMTDDFEIAVEEGATVIRVGRAIFEPDHSPETPAS